MAQYSHFRRTGTNLKTVGGKPQVAWYGIATIVLRYGYNLRNKPVLDADIRIRILGKRFIRNQIHRIGVYPYPISPRNAYPDNPCYTAGRYFIAG